MKTVLGKLRWMYLWLTTILMSLSNNIVVYANGTNYGKNAAEWISNEVFWIGVAVMIIGLVYCAAKKQWVGAITTVIGGGVILFLIKNPTQIVKIGETISKIVFGN